MMEGAILHIERDHTVPLEVLQELSTKYPTVTGSAIADGEHFKIAQLNGQVPPEALDQIQQQFKEHTRILYFANFSSHLDDDIQPFPLLDDDQEKAMLVGFAEGNLHAFAKPGISQGEAFQFVFNYVIPSIDQTCKAYEGDYEKIRDWLAQDDVKAAYIASMGDRGILVIMDLAGDVYVMNKHALDERPWGWCSRQLEYIDRPADGPVAVAPAPSMADAMRAAMGMGKPAAPPAPGPIAAPPPPPAAATAAAPQVDPADLYEEVLLKPAANLTKAQTLQQYKDWGFSKPPRDWEKKPAVKVRRRKEVLKLPDKPTVVKDLKEIGPALDNKAPAVASPTIPPKEQAYLKDVFLKNIGQSGQMEDPVKLHQREASIPSYFKLLGLTEGLEATFNWPFAKLWEHSHNSPSATALLLHNTRTAYYDLLKEVEKMTSPTVEVPAAPAAPPLPAAPPAPVPVAPTAPPAPPTPAAPPRPAVQSRIKSRTQAA